MEKSEKVRRWKEKERDCREAKSILQTKIRIEYIEKIDTE